MRILHGSGGGSCLPEHRLCLSINTILVLLIFGSSLDIKTRNLERKSPSSYLS